MEKPNTVEYYSALEREEFWHLLQRGSEFSRHDPEENKPDTNRQTLHNSTSMRSLKSPIHRDRMQNSGPQGQGMEGTGSCWSALQDKKVLEIVQQCKYAEHPRTLHLKWLR